MTEAHKAVLLVGEMNPYGADPHFALYPAPDGCSGHRLAKTIMATPSRQFYLDNFDRVNLCAGRWSIVKAREAAADIIGQNRQIVVLLGAKVCEAFAMPFVPFTNCLRGTAPTTFVTLPHPSGANRMWWVSGSYERARHALRTAGVILQ